MWITIPIGLLLQLEAKIFGGGETEEQEAGVESEGGGEDEGGEGDAVGHQDEGEEPPSAWTHPPELISCLICLELFLDLFRNYSLFRKYSCIWFESSLAYHVYHAALIL